jgi:hypothetical protein
MNVSAAIEIREEQMRKRRLSLGLATALSLTLALAIPGGASARRTVRIADLELRATNGYEAGVQAYKQTHPSRRARISVYFANDDGYALYRVPGRFTKRQIKGRFGGFGRINLRLQSRRGALSSRRSTAPQSGSRAEAAAKARFCVIGVGGTNKSFRGRIRFRGESDYARIHASRARGFVGKGEISCSSGGNGPRGTILTARAGQLVFHAATYRRDPGPFAYASEHRRQGRVSILRVAGSDDPSSVFNFDSQLTSAHVRPVGPPFTGSADFAAPDQWAGDLSVSFPGEPDVPLTGPGFTARLRHIGR